MGRRTAGYLAVILVTAYLFFMYDAPVLSGMLVFLSCFTPLPLAGTYLAALAGRKGSSGAGPRVPPLGERRIRRYRAGISLRNKSARMGLRYETIRRRSERRQRKKVRQTQRSPANASPEREKRRYGFRLTQNVLRR